MIGAFFAAIFCLIVAMVVAVVTTASNFRKKLAEARKAYEASLDQLRTNPSDPEINRQTLDLGRRISVLLKDVKGPHGFDETRIMNDMNAARAKASVKQIIAEHVSVTNTNTNDKLGVALEIKRLGELFLKGYLSAEEFERGKRLFLGSPPDKAASAVELLRELSLLRKQGTLSDMEFNMKKWEILSERLLPGKNVPASLKAGAPGSQSKSSGT